MQKNIINLRLQDKQALYQAYIPNIKNGAVFVSTDKPYQLGDEIFLLLNLMDEDEKIAVAGHVVWLTPMNPNNNKSSGIGIQFSDSDKGSTRKKIETYLATELNSEKTTLTL
ncbi:MAG: PilZ domain-containing protein [Gammaproteobacteria bacterium]|nr:PilZ domain-containing protein [Gammaproteobacteria bacterium]